MDTKDFFKLIGFTPKDGEDVTLDIVKNHLSDKFVHIDKIGDRTDLTDPIVNKAYGKRMKEVELELVKMAKASGLEITHSEVENKKLDEVIGIVGGKFTTKIKDSKGTGKPDKDVEKLETELSDWKAKYDQMKTSVETVQNEFNTFKANVTEKEKESLINGIKSKAIESVKFGSDVNEISKKGFRAIFNEKYNFVTNDQNEVEIRNKKDNSRVQNPDDLSKYLTASEAAERLAKEEGLLSKTGDGGKEVKTTKPGGTGAEQPKTYRRQASSRMGIKPKG